jgi:hypothetical protein
MDPSLAYLLIGSFGAVGAALAVGTLGALVRYHRTGAFPGAQRDAEGRSGPEPTPTRGRLVVLWLRVVAGVAVALWAIVVIRGAGLL